MNAWEEAYNLNMETVNTDYIITHSKKISWEFQNLTKGRYILWGF